MEFKVDKYFKLGRKTMDMTDEEKTLHHLAKAAGIRRNKSWKDLTINEKWCRVFKKIREVNK